MSIKKLSKSDWIASCIDGKMVKGTKYVELRSIDNKKWLKSYPVSKNEISHAIKLVAKSSWKEKSAPERALILRKAAALFHSHKELLANIMTKEMGKTIKEGLLEVSYASSFFDWFAGECERVYGLEIPSSNHQKRCFIRYEPIGPAALITPWNFPLAMPARKVSAALAAGCSLILKPSPETPLSALLLQEICFKAGVPKDAFQLLVGNEFLIGKELLDSPDIHKLSFTGSSAVGAKLYADSAKTFKKVTLELGGNAPFIVFEDADLDKAADGLIGAKLRNTGQTCIAANRILIQSTVLEKFLNLLTKKLKTLKIGSPFDPEIDISTCLHPISEKRIRVQKKEAIKKGAKCLFQKGKHLSLLYPVDPSMSIFHEETFGPLIPITSFKNDSEAIHLANQGYFGLAAYVFTKDLARTFFLTEALHYGIIGINDGFPSAAYASFGGLRSSGLGREGGPSGIYEYLNEKYLSLSL